MRFHHLLAAVATITMIIVGGVTIATTPQVGNNGNTEVVIQPSHCDECWPV